MAASYCWKLLVFCEAALPRAARPERTFTGYFSFLGARRYDREVFGIAGRRVAEALVALFALLGFAFVPLGQKTALEHSLAIFSTPAALAAFRELAGTVLRLKDRLVESVAPAPAKDQPKPELPRLPHPKSESRPSR